ncbi:hypothetical protein A3860_23490 [Niastella vici]|uniref:Iron dicitrate transport regulator FecR n=1 Tax=Niastella vici TaxID=1703345 RepID=A0A1V9G049_9BACT|nr:FecR family protein [Niastella vici]OQP63898.1 hypothetical protein A3860_23490 [Niastella vici]
MEENSPYYKELIRRYRDSKATEEELEVFFHLLSEGTINQELEDVMNEDMPGEERTVHRIPFYKLTAVRVAAAVLLILATAGGYWLSKKRRESPLLSDNKPLIKHDLPPGGNKAILELADGSSIVLDSASNGTLSRQGATEISKKDGMLAYNQAGKKQGEILFNTIKTPRGGQYQLKLADGTKVWLNAASSLRFPAAFSGNVRKVELTGEAYFEVAKNAKMPFIVQEGGMSVQVLGTHFNVNGYDDEDAVRTTLLEGSVKVSKGGASVMLKPGEQTSVSHTSQLSQPIPVQTDEVMAWKNGLFYFNGENIAVIMRQLARWYDFDVTYEKPVKEKFYVKINRNTNVSNVFKILETTGGAHFKIEGKKITVMP